jgi:CHAD domain-containing protein
MNKKGHIQWDESTGAALNARDHLPRLISVYFTQGRELLAKNPAPAELHSLRLATKRLRYTLELFRPCYGPGFRQRLDSLRRVQQLLGEINDCATASAVLARSKSPARHARIDAFLRQHALHQAGAFRREWQEVFDAPGQESWWTGYLARHARPPGRKPAGST